MGRCFRGARIRGHVWSGRRDDQVSGGRRQSVKDFRQSVDSGSLQGQRAVLQHHGTGRRSNFNIVPDVELEAGGQSKRLAPVVVWGGPPGPRGSLGPAFRASLKGSAGRRGRRPRTRGVRPTGFAGLFLGGSIAARSAYPGALWTTKVLGCRIS